MTATSELTSARLLAAARVMLDPTRIEILHVIRERSHLCEEIDGFTGIHVSDIVETIRIPQPMVSKHLIRLREAGLVTAHRRGQWIYYLRDEVHITQVKAFFDSL